jgi:hypothetical protein
MKTKKGGKYRHRRGGMTDNLDRLISPRYSTKSNPNIKRGRRRTLKKMYNGFKKIFSSNKVGIDNTNHEDSSNKVGIDNTNHEDIQVFLNPVSTRGGRKRKIK